MLHGVLAAALTPLRGGGTAVDEGAIPAYVHYLVAGGLDGVLVLGTTVLDDSPPVAAAVGDQLRPVVSALGVRAIRLLGCSTATSERGRNALRRISLAARCDVLGTRRYVSKHDYGPSGFTSDGALVGARALAALIRARSGTPARSS